MVTQVRLIGTTYLSQTGQKAGLQCHHLNFLFSNACDRNLSKTHGFYTNQNQLKQIEPTTTVTPRVTPLTWLV